MNAKCVRGVLSCFKKGQNFKLVFFDDVANFRLLLFRHSTSIKMEPFSVTINLFKNICHTSQKKFLSINKVSIRISKCHMKECRNRCNRHIQSSKALTFLHIKHVFRTCAMLRAVILLYTFKNINFIFQTIGFKPSFLLRVS